MAATKVFVGSLPAGSKPEELRHLFENYGIVVECDVMNRCGFVHMETPEMACDAILALNATEFKGQLIVVEPGRPKDRKGAPGIGGDGGRGMIGPPRNVHGGRGGRGGRGGGRGAGSIRTEDVGIVGSRGNMAPGGSIGPDSPLRRSYGGDPGRRGNSTFSPNNEIGPMRSDNFKHSRNTPYSRGGGGGGGSVYGRHGQGHGSHPFSPRGNKFGSSSRGGYHNAGSNAYNNGGGDNMGMRSHAYDDWSLSNGSQSSLSGAGMGIGVGGGGGGGGGRHYNDNTNYLGGFSGNMGASSNYGSNKMGGGGGSGPQDRRGFALPSGGHQEQQHQQQQGFGNKIQGGYGGGNEMRNNYPRRSGEPHFNINGGGPRGRSGFGGPHQSFSGGGGFQRNGSIGGGNSSYNKEFPPLGQGSNRGSRARIMPHQNMMPNRRF